jgi:hypothetical protein
MTVQLRNRLQAKMRDAIPELPSFDMPCERKVTREGRRGQREFGGCGKTPTFLLQRRRPHRTARQKVERRLYCEDHAIRSSGVWEPVKGKHDG